MIKGQRRALPKLKSLDDHPHASTSIRRPAGSRCDNLGMPSDADRPRAPLDLDRVLEPIVRELVAEGAAAVVLAGSHARGEAGELSDVDLYAIGNGPHYTLRA